MGDQNGGGFPPLLGLQRGQSEIVRRSELDEIRADDARGARIVKLNVLLAGMEILSVLLIGPLAIVIFVCIAVVCMAYILTQWLELDLRLGGVDGFVVVWSIALSSILLWLFVVDNWLWAWIVTWYPFPLLLPWWAVGMAWALLGAAAWGFNDLRAAHRKSLENRNSPPTFEQAPWWISPHFRGMSVTPEDDPQLEELKASLADVLNQKPVEVPRPVVVYNKNNPKPDEPVDFELESPEKFVSPTGVTCLWSEFVEFVQHGLSIGITTPVWQKHAHWGKPYIEALQATARLVGIAKYGGKGSPNVLTIRTRGEAARALFDAHRQIYSENHPPTLLESDPSESSDELELAGRKV